MNTIKEQVNSLVKFTATTLDALLEERDTIQDRITEGLEKMEQSKVFSEIEVKEISQFALNTLNTRYSCARVNITNKLRASFEF